MGERISPAADGGQDQRDDAGLSAGRGTLCNPWNRLHRTNSMVVYKRGLTRYFLRKLQEVQQDTGNVLSVCYDQWSFLLCGLLEAQHYRTARDTNGTQCCKKISRGLYDMFMLNIPALNRSWRIIITMIKQSKLYPQGSEDSKLIIKDMMPENQ